jgi:hypothetical protein
MNNISYLRFSSARNNHPRYEFYCEVPDVDVTHTTRASCLIRRRLVVQVQLGLTQRPHADTRLPQAKFYQDSSLGARLLRTSSTWGDPKTGVRASLADETSAGSHRWLSRLLLEFQLSVYFTTNPDRAFISGQ